MLFVLKLSRPLAMLLIIHKTSTDCNHPDDDIFHRSVWLFSYFTISPDQEGLAQFKIINNVFVNDRLLSEFIMRYDWKTLSDDAMFGYHEEFYRHESEFKFFFPFSLLVIQSWVINVILSNVLINMLSLLILILYFSQCVLRPFCLIRY